MCISQLLGAIEAGLFPGLVTLLVSRPASYHHMGLTITLAAGLLVQA